MPERKESLFSASIKAKTRMYFIDVREASNGSKYLSMCESKKVDGEYQKSRIMIFDSEIPEFFKALREASPALKG